MTKRVAEEFLDFVNKTGSPYHSVLQLKNLLLSFGFQQLNEGFQWGLQPGGKYFFTRNFSTITAFVIGENFNYEKSRFLIACGHTDSPALKLRSNSNIQRSDIFQLSVECYGGGLWDTWFDRGLGVAGKVIINDGDKLAEKLVFIKKPLAILPNLAVHLRTSDERYMKLNTEKHLLPFTATSTIQKFDSKISSHISPILLKAISKELSCKEEDVKDADLFLMDATESRFCGLENEFIESPRLDNLCCTYTIFSAIAQSSEILKKGKDIYIASGFDNEEIGSMTYTGAFSSMLKDTMENIIFRLTNLNQIFSLIPRSYLISADMGHAVHPNFMDKYQPEHTLYPNKGVAIKLNPQQKYTTTAQGISLISKLAEMHQIPVQTFVVPNDKPCGSTVGPILSSSLGIRAVDIGIPQWAMHSIRESCAALDIEYHHELIKMFYQNFASVDDNLQKLDDN